MRSSLIAVVLPTLLACNVAMAQGIPAPTPSVGPTSPLGLGTTPAASPTGIPLGATELASPGISPAPTGVTGTIAMPGSTTSCSTVGTSPSTMYGSTSTYDGGGMSGGGATPATAPAPGMPTSGMSASSGGSMATGTLDTSGMSGMCGSGSGSVAASSTPTSTSPTTPGGIAGASIPLGSTEIGNLGVSSAAPVPTMSVSPPTGGVMTTVVPAVPAGTPITPGR